MFDKTLSIIAPHHCCGCDKVDTLLCDNCKYNITSELKTVCISCHRPTNHEWLCNSCRHMPYEHVWLVGERDGALQRLVGLYKFERAKAAVTALSDLLLAVLPDLPAETVIVPIPTTSSRIRERGYDHMLLIAKYVAKTRGLKCQQLLVHRTNTKQRQASAKQRALQASQAFAIRGEIDADIPYLIIDDVITTGATIKYASKALSGAGAKHIWVAAVARQVLGSGD